MGCILFFRLEGYRKLSDQVTFKLSLENKQEQLPQMCGKRALEAESK